jgi:hypothetical protein
MTTHNQVPSRWLNFALLPVLLVFCALGQVRLAAQQPQPEMPPDQQAPAQEAAPPADEDETPAQPEQPAQPAAPENHAAPTAESTPAVPAASMPNWPVNERPGQPTVTWDSQGLSIDAKNSSLQQILRDVCTATGAKLEGMGKDERVFGVYGPGQAREVLSQLLLGAGYNVIMIGDQGQGAPRQILLSTRRTGTDQTGNNNGSANNSDEDDSDASDDQPAFQPPMRPGFSGRNPQQRLEEQRLMMQQRQQMLQQQTQPQQPGQPGQPPPPQPQN